MKRIAAAVLGFVVLLVAAVFIYYNFIRGDAPEAFGLTEADEQGEASQAGGDTSETETGTTEQAGPEAVELDGSWSVSSGSEAGYRVVEDLGSIQNFEAVGRTNTITGSLEISGTTITSARFEVDVASVTSDDGRRDGQFRGDVMNADEFPTATLALTDPIDLGSVPAAATAVTATANGELTLRGVTNAVTIPVQAQLLGDQIEIVASIDVLFSDYGIDNPSNSFVSVRDEGKVEVKLLLSKG